MTNNVILFEELVETLRKTFFLSRKNIEQYVEEFSNDTIFYSSLFSEISILLKKLKKCDQCKTILIHSENKCIYCSRNLERVILLETTLDFLNIYKKINDNFGFFLFGKFDKNNLQINEFKKFIESRNLKEIIFAFSPSIKSELLYKDLTNYVSEKFPKLKITKLAIGIPFNGSLEYIDEKTFLESFKNRK